jgi:hypothetical protein
VHGEGGGEVRSRVGHRQAEQVTAEHDWSDRVSRLGGSSW